MTIPALFFALLIALFYGTVYHLIRDGSVGRLILFFILSIIGFTLGHLVGLWRGWVWIPVGSINLGLSSMGSLLILVFGDWLTRMEMREESKV